MGGGCQEGGHENPLPTMENQRSSSRKIVFTIELSGLFMVHYVMILKVL